MTLKEQFDNAPIIYNENLEVITDYQKIADDYVISFAEWCSYYREKNRNSNLDMLHAKSKYDESYTTKELLEIYKQEKGL